ncbi:MAG: ABC transporter permease [Cyclobacteriaceae bacterium]|nr:ABC transporter permease [Cyclobacteriaceae bacterium]
MKSNQPPKAFLKLFRWYCHPKLVDHIEGDLIEVYQQRLEKLGKRKADIRFMIDVLLLFRQRIIKPMEGYQNLNMYGMYKNYFKTSLRHLIKNKTFTFINVFGLVLGISFSTMLYTYVSNELSYDSFHPKSDRTYRVLWVNKSIPDNTRTFGSVVPLIGPELVNSFPEVEEMTRLFQFSGQVVVEIGEAKYSERSWFTTEDANFLSVFDFDFIAGDKATALSHSFSVVLTESTAKKYFGEENALGKTMNLQNLGEVKVTGILKDLPKNSHLQFDLLFSKILVTQDWTDYLNSWQDIGAFTYVVLKEGKSIHEVEAKMPAFRKKHWGPDLESREIAFQPIQDIHLYSGDIQNGSENEHGQLSYVYIFSSMAIFLLIIAAINYINLTTSKASSRSKEIGIRKVAGAVKTQLIFQFLTEAFIITLASMLLSILMMDLCFPFFNSITGKDFDLSLKTIGEFMPALLTITLIIGVIAGSYPAFYLSKLKPVAVLKGQAVFTSNRFNLRTTLVVFQFTITIVLIVATLVISNQINFIQTKDMGFNKDQLMIIDINSGAVRRQFQAMKNEFAKLVGVQQVAVSSRVPGEWKNIRQVYVRNTNEATANSDSLQTYFMGFDEDMLNTYQLQLAAGRFFNGTEADSINVVMNASAVKAMNLQNPIGTVVQITTQNSKWNARVIGVLQDFNFQSLHQKIAPIIIGYHNNPVQVIDYFTLKISGDAQPLIEGATKVCEKFDPETPIEYHFLSEQLNNFYVSEKKAGMIFQMAGALSILVACLGLLGLANYHVERKTKELGIRKILGAGSLNLFLMVSLSFTRQVVIAFVLACPLAWYLMREWLSAFEYRIPLSAGVFVLAGAVVLLLALLTVSYQSVRAAMFNPIDSLRTE